MTTVTIECDVRLAAGFNQQPVWNSGENEECQKDKEWLDSLQSMELLPVNTLLHNCLIQPIQDQVCSLSPFSQ